MRRRGPDTDGKARHSNTERHRHSAFIAIRAERVIGRVLLGTAATPRTDETPRA
jgi:hypothetical protein